MNNNLQDEGIDYLDVDNVNQQQNINNTNVNNTVTVQNGDKQVNATINPNAYHPSLNQTQNVNSANQNTVGTTIQGDNNQSVNTLKPQVQTLDDNYDEVKDNKIIYILLAVANFILTMGIYGLMGISVLVTFFGIVLHRQNDSLSYLVYTNIEIWAVVLVAYLIRIPIRRELDKYSVGALSILGNVDLVAMIFNVISYIFGRRR